MKQTALMVLALAGAALAVPKNPTKIVGGSDTTIQQYNFMAAMHYGWFGVAWAQACGGALLTSTTVLSASHCYIYDPVSFWRVQVGSTHPEIGGQYINVLTIILHPQYNDNTLDNDVAIIRLASSAVFGANVGPAQIAGQNYNLPDNTPITAVGWGTLWSGGPSPDVLQHVEVFTINWQLCADRYAQLKSIFGYGSWPDITPGMACAGILDVGGKDACQGDSGGPVVHNGNVVYGVTSWGFGCANGTYPGVNANVPYFQLPMLKYTISVNKCCLTLLMSSDKR